MLAGCFSTAVGRGAGVCAAATELGVGELALAWGPAECASAMCEGVGWAAATGLGDGGAALGCCPVAECVSAMRGAETEGVAAAGLGGAALGVRFGGMRFCDARCRGTRCGMRDRWRRRGHRLGRSNVQRTDPDAARIRKVLFEQGGSWQRGWSRLRDGTRLQRLQPLPSLRRVLRRCLPTLPNALPERHEALAEERNSRQDKE